MDAGYRNASAQIENYCRFQCDWERDEISLKAFSQRESKANKNRSKTGECCAIKFEPAICILEAMNIF